jgi:hypothetical protein
LIRKAYIKLTDSKRYTKSEEFAEFLAEGNDTITGLKGE